MTRWIRYVHEEKTSFGTLQGDAVQPHCGTMFGANEPEGNELSLDQVKLLTPCVPTKMLGLWRNFQALGQHLNMPDPVDPLYFIKANSSFLNPGDTIRKPLQFNGSVVFEGELGIVIGKTATAVDEDQAEHCIFGYTCINDVTALEAIQDSVFPHWTRGKGFDTFGPFGPCITTGLNWRTASVKSTLNGVQRQHYPLHDMVMSPSVLVSRISFDMTLMPGDVIACGTSMGVGRLKPGCSIDIEIQGIGILSNRYEAAVAAS